MSYRGWDTLVQVEIVLLINSITGTLLSTSISVKQSGYYYMESSAV